MLAEAALLEAANRAAEAILLAHGITIPQSFRKEIAGIAAIMLDSGVKPPAVVLWLVRTGREVSVAAETDKRVLDNLP